MQISKLILVCGVLCAGAVTGRVRAAEDQTATATDDAAVANTAAWPPAQYAFDYAVNDPLTGDLKDQQETRSGDAVVGYYRTMDSDGLVRTVRYQADAANGFQAEVVREPAATGGAGAVARSAGLVATATSSVAPAIVPAPYPATAAAAYYRGLSYPFPAYLPPPYSARDAYHPSYSAYAYQSPPPYAAYHPLYSPYAAYQPLYSPYAHQPYGRGARFAINGVQYATAR